MKLKIGWAALLLLLAGAVPGYGQKVYKQGNAIVLDCGPDSGFPQGAVEKQKGKKLATGTPSDSAGPLANNDPEGSINATVYQKLEIAPTDLPNGMTWATAYLSCQKLGEGWRLPTQRELILIFLFRDAVGSLGTSSFYWTGTEQNATSSCYLMAQNFQMTSGPKTKIISVKVRCVREM